LSRQWRAAYAADAVCARPTFRGTLLGALILGTLLLYLGFAEA
jgi:hypothetical protein